MIRNERQKNTTRHDNYIIKLFGLSAWWTRVCRPDKRFKLKQSNQDAKLSFLKNYSTSIVSRQKEILNIPEKSANHRNVLGVINKKKRLRDNNTSVGESSRIAKKINFEKINMNPDPAESSRSDGPRPNC